MKHMLIGAISLRAAEVLALYKDVTCSASVCVYVCVGGGEE